FFQAEDGIRDLIVTGVQTCALPISNAFYLTIEKLGFKKESRCGYAMGIDWMEPTASLKEGDMTELKPNMTFHLMLGNWIEEDFEIGRASCRERVEIWEVEG